MRLTRSRSLAVLVAVAMTAASAVATAFERIGDRVSSACADVFAFALRLAFGTPKAAKDGDRMDGKPARMLTAARSFMEGLCRRESPRIESRWRMCPSA